MWKRHLATVTRLSLILACPECTSANNAPSAPGHRPGPQRKRGPHASSTGINILSALIMEDFVPQEQGVFPWGTQQGHDSAYFLSLVISPQGWCPGGGAAGTSLAVPPPLCPGSCCASSMAATTRKEAGTEREVHTRF